MAEADPKNIRNIATPQEAADALARYIENSDATEAPQRVTATGRKKQRVTATDRKKQRVTATDRKKHLKELKIVLCTIAKHRNLEKPDDKAEIIRNKLIHRIEGQRSGLARNWRYGRSVESEERQSKRSDAWLCYVIRYTNNKRKTRSATRL
jgi:hypothetical protein